MKGPIIPRPTAPTAIVFSRPQRSESMPARGNGNTIPNSKAIELISNPCSIGGSMSTSMKIAIHTNAERYGTKGTIARC